MSDTNFDLGVRVGFNSDDAAVQNFEGELRKVMDRLDDTGAKARKFQDDLATLTKGLQEGKLSQEQYATAVAQLKEKLQDTGKAAEETGGKIGDTGGVLGKVQDYISSSILKFIGLAAVVRGAWKAFGEAESKEHILNQLAVNARQFAGATEEDVAQLKEWAVSASEASGVGMSQWAPTMDRLLALTHSTTDAEKLMQVMLSAQVQGLGDVNESLRAITAAYEEQEPINRGFGMILRQNHLEGESWRDTLNRLIATMGDAGASFRDTATDAARARQVFKEAAADLGSIFLPVGNAVIGVLRFMAFWLEGLATMGRRFGADWTSGMEMASVATFAFRQAALGNFEPAKKLLSDIKDIDEKHTEALKQLGDELDKVGARIFETAGTLKGKLSEMFGPPKGSAEEWKAYYEKRLLEAQSSAKSEDQVNSATAQIYKEISQNMALDDKTRQEASAKLNKLNMEEAKKAAADLLKSEHELASAQASDIKAVIAGLEEEVKKDGTTAQQREALYAKLAVARKALCDKEVAEVRRAADEEEKSTKGGTAARENIEKAAQLKVQAIIHATATANEKDEQEKTKQNKAEAEKRVKAEQDEDIKRKKIAAETAKEEERDIAASVQKPLTKNREEWVAYFQKLNQLRNADRNAIKKEGGYEVAEAKGDGAKIEAARVKMNLALQRSDEKYFANLKKEIGQMSKYRLQQEMQLGDHLVSLMGQYGGKTGQKIAQVVQVAKEAYELWQEISDIFFATEEIKTAESLLTQTAAQKAADVAEAEMTTDLWAIYAASAMASIPYVGPALAAAAAAEAEAAGQALTAAIAAVPVAAGGAYLSRPTMLMAGEAGPELVLPNRFTSMFEAMSRMFGGQLAPVHSVHNTTNGARTIINAQISTLTGAHAEWAMNELARRIDRASPAVDRLLLSRPRIHRGSARRVRP